jgi:hypothetical protein
MQQKLDQIPQIIERSFENLLNIRSNATQVDSHGRPIFFLFCDNILQKIQFHMGTLPKEHEHVQRTF